MQNSIRIFLKHSKKQTKKNPNQQKRGHLRFQTVSGKKQIVLARTCLNVQLLLPKSSSIKKTTKKENQLHRKVKVNNFKFEFVLNIDKVGSPRLKYNSIPYLK